MGQVLSRINENRNRRQQQQTTENNTTEQNTVDRNNAGNDTAADNATNEVPAPEPQPDPQPEPEPVAPAEPAPQQPDPQPDVGPVEPEPVQPEPEPEPEPQPQPDVQPEPVQPEPVQPEPAQPDPQPEPVPEPEPVQPEPVQPEPVQPEPVQPEPVQPEPVQPEPEPVQPEPVPEPVPEPEVPVAPVEPAVDVVEDVVAVRKEINSLSPQENDRFFNAVNKMMENKNGPGTSEYFRVAGYHGRPGDYMCSHGVETFPGWHRIYLLEFQNALQAADRELGNDGNIGLPYWDWMVNNDGLPPSVREKFGRFPQDLFPNNSSERWPSIARHNDSRISRNIRRFRIVQNAEQSLLATQHWAHASTAHSDRVRYPSLEASHNSVHGVVGRPMSGLNWAAYDILFWLHHCNVDRIYEGYLAVEPDSRAEFEQKQDTTTDDLFDTPFKPFKKPNGDDWYPHETFDTVALGYRYDDVPRPNAQAMMEVPTYAIFKQIRIHLLNGVCYELHVFVRPKDEADDAWQPPNDADVFDDDQCYAGAAMIFGRGTDCETCRKRPPFDVRVEITDALRAVGVSRYDAKVVVLAIPTTEDEERVIPLEETPIEPPVIDGPLFENRETALDVENREQQDSNDVRALQEYLKAFGYYADEVDGDFGPVTDAAVRKYQELAGLVVDGLVGPVTKKQILNASRCGERDVEEGVTVTNVEVSSSAFDNNVLAPPRDQGPFYGRSKNIKYGVGIVPGYLNRGDVLNAFDEVFNEWSRAVNGLTFEFVDTIADEAKNDIDINISFNDANDQSKFIRFDGAGGVLARGGEGFLNFDSAERWSLNPNETGNLEDASTWRRGDPLVLLQHCALHEIGHCLGLGHSNERSDVMAPYYNPSLLQLSDGDKQRVAALYNEA